MDENIDRAGDEGEEEERRKKGIFTWPGRTERTGRRNGQGKRRRKRDGYEDREGEGGGKAGTPRSVPGAETTKAGSS